MKINYQIHIPIDFIFDFLTDMEKFASIHPVITKIEKSDINSYLVFETLRFAGLKYSFTYPVTLKADHENKKIVMTAKVMKIISIQMVFHIWGDSAYSRINEEINFKTVLPIKLLMGNIFKKQHAQLFKNMETAFNH